VAALAIALYAIADLQTAWRALAGARP